MAILTGLGQFLLLLLPMGLSAAAVKGDCLPLVPLAAVLMLLLIRVLPLCRGDELPWTVLLTLPVGLPVNLMAVGSVSQILWGHLPPWMAFLRQVLALYILFSVETLFLCLLMYLFRSRK